MKRLILLLVPAVMGTVLFVSAGRLDLPFFWIMLAATTLVMQAGFSGVDPDLMKERWRPGPGGVDRHLRWLAIPPLIAQLVVAGLDAGRYQWSAPMPAYVKTAAIVLCCAGTLLSGWAMRVNRFFSPVVRIQEERGHKLVTDGPYRFVRHPGYVGSLLAWPCFCIALGSWWSMLALAPALVLIVRRAAIEDRYLHQHLPGYAEYARQVRWRLVPGVW
ncbi:MAG: isoprenylcysteine carboxylmethyltransferase family protein [Phycisphaerae bacterium]|nr:isoprenylcysteine carboxylmethyltransferase family protein [Phycisphaerae bacterium]NUQ46171.1 isoprenylcysteine carboxylmethyltransferase family protein [Phycisphaerae bacterium]